MRKRSFFDVFYLFRHSGCYRGLLFVAFFGKNMRFRHFVPKLFLRFIFIGSKACKALPKLIYTVSFIENFSRRLKTQSRLNPWLELDFTFIAGHLPINPTIFQFETYLFDIFNFDSEW
jgi:hypothetical protein